MLKLYRRLNARLLAINLYQRQKLQGQQNPTNTILSNICENPWVADIAIDLNTFFTATRKTIKKDIPIAARLILHYNLSSMLHTKVNTFEFLNIIKALDYKYSSWDYYISNVIVKNFI